MRYLGSEIIYDNISTPLSLQAYPYEIFSNILANSGGIQIKRVLDIGGNIGQFSITLSKALKGKVHIDVLEPNAEIFYLLRQNTAHMKNIKIYNVGVGEPLDKSLFYTPGRSATGSLIEKNATLSSPAKKIPVELIDNIAKVSGCQAYDLIKIDVEGYEYSLIKAIKPLKTKLMFLEVSAMGRSMNFHHSELFSLIEKKFGTFNVLHVSEGDYQSNNFDVLLRFE